VRLFHFFLLPGLGVSQTKLIKQKKSQHDLGPMLQNFFFFNTIDIIAKKARAFVGEKFFQAGLTLANFFSLNHTLAQQQVLCLDRLLP
jgi:hypothetical protein